MDGRRRMLIRWWNLQRYRWVREKWWIGRYVGAGNYHIITQISRRVHRRLRFRYPVLWPRAKGDSETRSMSRNGARCPDPARPRLLRSNVLSFAAKESVLQKSRAKRPVPWSHHPAFFRGFDTISIRFLLFSPSLFFSLARSKRNGTRSFFQPFLNIFTCHGFKMNDRRHASLSRCQTQGDII